MAGTLVLTGGGTAGHVLPNVALVKGADSELGRAVRSGTVTVTYIGSEAGMERDLVRSAAPEWTYVPISAGRLRRFLTPRNLLTPFKVAAGCWQARRALARMDEPVLFSKGGFVSAPVVWAAWSLGIPVVIHESDRTPALTTRLTIGYADRAFCAFEDTKTLVASRHRDKLEVVGLPLRAELFNAERAAGLAHFGLTGERPVILVFGGSLGARVLNEAVGPLVTKLCQHYDVIHLVGRNKSFTVEGLTEDMGYRQYEYLSDDMALALAATDLALCRAGASSLFELAALRIPMIVVPLDLDQSRGDQIENARYFAERGWATVIREAQLTDEALLAAIDEAMGDRDARQRALEQAPRTQAISRIGDVLLELMARGT